MNSFQLHHPNSVSEAVSLLKDGAKLLAGGHTLLPTIKQRLASPNALVSLAKIAELAGITEEKDAIKIGAMTTHAQVASSDQVRLAIPALAGLASLIGDSQVRNCGTIGGSVANNDPAADYPSAVLALNATIHTNKRAIAADNFFTGLFTTDLADDEIITALSFPVPEAAGYSKFAQSASLYALTGVFVAKSSEGVRVAVTGAGSDGVFRAKEIEEALSKDFSASVLDNVVVSGTMLEDIHGSVDYRRNMITVVAKRAVEAA